MNQSITKDEKISNSPKTNDREKIYQVYIHIFVLFKPIKQFLAYFKLH